jgi:hypothetical protein
VANWRADDDMLSRGSTEHAEGGSLAWTFYRSVRTDPAEEADFLSHIALGRHPRSTDPRVIHQWEGVSVFVSYERARANAESWRWKMGEYIAELSIPDGVPITVEGPDERDHCNLYDVAGAVLLEHVTRVIHGPLHRVLPNLPG